MDQTQPTRHRSQRLLRIMLPVSLVVIGVLVFTTLKASRPAPPVSSIEERSWTVRTLQASPGIHQPVLTLYGRVESPRMTQLTAAITAFVSQVYVDEGDSVTGDSVLIRLDPRDARLLLQQREADIKAIQAQIEAEHVRHKADQKALKIETDLLALNQRAVSRFENLARRKVGTEDQLDNARRSWQQQALALNSRRQALADHPNRLAQLEANLQRASALRDSAQLDLERTVIRAPFAGRIARLQSVPGDRVRSGDPLINLYNPQQLEVRAQIPAPQLATIREAINNRQTIQASTRTGMGTIELRLDRLASEVDGGRAGVDALFMVQGNQTLEPGRALQLILQLPELDNVIALPPQALYGLNRIYKVQEGRLFGVDVERLGSSLTGQGENRVLVRSPEIHRGDRIVTTQLPNAISGLKVRDTQG